ncbi:MAG: uroporphyrinogen decarboxylase family protein [Candidatus Caldatribacterium sp.]|nr:uroporphyrinogen decarboxylase family protein [Candidatus Caldatribacterium sp.]
MRRSTHRFSLKELALTFWEEGKRPVVPLMGYPGIQLTGTNIKQNQFNHLVQFQTLSRLYDAFHPDAMFFLMDLSVEASALGLPVRFPLDDTPSVEAHPVKSLADLDHFRKIDILGDGRVIVYLETLRHMRAAFPCPVGAYVIGPLTLAGLLVGANEIAMQSVLDEAFFQGVLDFAKGVVLRYAEALKEAGADTIMVLEPTAVIFGPETFRKSLAPLYRELVGILDDVEVILHVCGNTHHLIPEMKRCGVAGLSLDSAVNLPEVFTKEDEILLLGNVSPVSMLLDTPKEVYEATLRLLEAMKEYPYFILSTGCDLPQDVPFASIEAFFKAGRDWRIEGKRKREVTFAK